MTRQLPPSSLQLLARTTVDAALSHLRALHQLAGVQGPGALLFLTIRTACV